MCPELFSLTWNPELWTPFDQVRHLDCRFSNLNFVIWLKFIFSKLVNRDFSQTFRAYSRLSIFVSFNIFALQDLLDRSSDLTTSCSDNLALETTGLRDITPRELNW